ncbi:MAG: hypothetical protein IH627_17320 [Rubrivivax sp.]|nr:hypothetical protein [Rubrivivax sp.]
MTSAKAPPAIRLVFQLDRAENPRLYDDLVRFNKGVRRVNRLRVLAYDGLLNQEGLLLQRSTTGRSDDRPEPGDDGAPEEGSGVITNGLFEPAIGE